jgi:hypothetical protein
MVLPWLAKTNVASDTPDFANLRCRCRSDQVLISRDFNFSRAKTVIMLKSGAGKGNL